jgi:1-acyl-sn-glycerol-3-phosphate acyltransferase
MMIRTVFTALWVVVITLIIAPASAFFAVLKKDGALVHHLGRIWGKTILLISGVKVQVFGLRNLDPTETYVFMANHQSMFDILVLFAHLPVQFRWLAKKELFSIPVMGYAMGKVGHIPIDRSDRRSAHKSLVNAARKISGGTPVIIFPEGSRSNDGVLMPFKPGGFHLAVRAGRPIMPVVISGTSDVMRKGSLRISPANVTISLHVPVNVQSYGKDKKALMDTIYAMMKQDLDRIRAKVADSQLQP